MKYSAVVLTLGLLIVAIGSGERINASQGARRQGAGPQEDVLPALLVEVRGLRAAMEQMASAGPRVQLALGRVQLQEQRVNTLMRRLEESRAHAADAQRKYEQLQQEIRNTEVMIREPRPDAPPLAELQNMQRGSERELARLAADVQRITTETTVMEGDLATEQGRWIELNQRMEALEQSLVRR
jgi:chromosome segregation ATPase